MPTALTLFLAALSVHAPTVCDQPGHPSPIPAIAENAKADIDVLHYAFDLVLSDETDRIEGLARVTFRFRREGVAQIALDLASPSESTGMTVGAVYDTESRLAWQHDYNQLRITLPQPSREAEERTISIEYAGVPSDGLIISSNLYGERTFFGDNWPDRARHWLPSVDHPSDKATVEFRVTAPSRYQVIGSGELVEETDLEGATRLTHWRTAVPIATKVMVIGAARFAVQHVDRIGGVPLQSWVYPQDRDRGFFDFALAGRILRHFVDLIGPYPYEKLANVQSRTRYGGMENAGNIFYAESSVRGDRSSESLLAHEIAHQWFGDSVTEQSWHHVWLSEGFASYLTQMYMEHTYGTARLKDGMRDARESVLRYHAMAPDSPVIDTTIVDPNRMLSTNSYQKGAWVLHMLRSDLGDMTFNDGIRTFYREYRDGNAWTDDFRRVMERVSGRDLAAFFDQWLRRPGQPALAGTWSWNDPGGALSVEITQESGSLFDVPLELAVHYASGPPSRFTVRLDEPRERFSLPTERKPVRVELDPDVRLLMESTFREK